jgi:hypothetical protein
MGFNEFTAGQLYHALPKGILDLLMIDKCQCVTAPQKFPISEKGTQKKVDIETVLSVEQHFQLSPSN